MHCKKNQATKTKEEMMDGKKTSGFYCAECYRTLFLSTEESAKLSPVKCPYCGKSKESVLKSALVGCANCYTTFAKELMPLIVKNQGERAHGGKTPYAMDRKARLQIRYDELQVLIRRRTEEEDVKKVEEYSKESMRIRRLQEGGKHGGNS
ncbi:MAG: hypothetical protein IJX18_01325 [Clostridia bacterium]|nr:hypothetical protein [Clostridia bacterium]